MKKLISAFAALLVSIAAFIFVSAASAATVNLIANPSVEQSAGGVPTSWSTLKTGTSTTAFNYLSTGHTGSHSLQVQMSKRNGGNAKWYFNPITVKPNTKYTFTDWYQSNVQTHLQVAVTDTADKTNNVGSNNQAASTAWKQASISFTTPSNAKTVTVYHYINQNGQLTTDDFDIEGTVPTPPTIGMTSPTTGTTVSGTQTVSANATDTDGVASVQFLLDGSNLGLPDTTAPYSISWNTVSAINGNHTLGAVATNKSGLTAPATPITVNVQNIAPTPPTVSFTNPAASSTISGLQGVTVNASADTVGVQFKLDNNTLGAEDTSAPFSINWDTTAATNGSHTLSATARNGAGLTTTATETVNVQNVTTPPPTSVNLLANPSFETSTNGTSPDSWISSNWGTNTSTFSYLNSGHTGNHSVRVDTTAYTNGAANWYYNDVPVAAGKTYKYENWYQSNVDTEVDAEVIMTNGTTQYYWLGTVLASTAWAKFSTTFTAPVGAKSVAIYQILAKKGYIVSDDYYLGEYTPLAWNRGLVTVSFDDGWASQYQNALPLLNKYGIKSTFYIISGELNDTPDYMTTAQVKNLYAQGMEIGSHTITHSDLTQVSQTQLVQEMSQSQATLQAAIGAPVVNFAYPYGAYNANTIVVGKQYYRSQRSVNQGYNTKDNLDLTQLKIYEVDSNITNAQVEGWIQGAVQQKAWLILLYHEVGMSIGGDIYHVNTADLDTQMNYLKSTGVAVVTLNQALDEVTAQQ